jgi:hypothetical protein
VKLYGRRLMTTPVPATDQDAAWAALGDMFVSAVMWTNILEQSDGTGLPAFDPDWLSPDWRFE